MATKKKTKPKRQAIEDSLVSQLERAGRNTPERLALIGAYMEHYDTLKRLDIDIRRNGVRVKAINGNGIEVEKPNESVQSRGKVVATMLTILKELKLDPLTDKPDGPTGDGGY